MRTLFAWLGQRTPICPEDGRSHTGRRCVGGCRFAASPGALKLRIAGCLSAALCLAALIPGTAQASYPGANGLIAYELVRVGRADSDQIDVLTPGASRKSATIAYCGKPRDSLAFNYSAPAFSPDGRKVAFSQLNAADCAPPTCCFQRISIANADGSGAHALPRLTAHDRSPQFLASGKRLVFAGRPHRNAPYDLYTVSTRGRRLRRLTTFGADDPAPCADGSIAFVHRGDVYRLSANGRGYRRLTFKGARAPRCSPDSRLIAFVNSPYRSYPGRPGDLYVIGRSGGHLRRLTSHHDQDGFDPTGVVGAPAFSPSGGLIAVTDQQIPSPQQQPPAPDAESFVTSTEYLEVVNLHGRRSGPTVHLGDNSFTGGFTTPGGVSWQPLPGR